MGVEASSANDLFAGRYRLEGVAGVGGIGIVYRASDLETGTTVALKTIRDADEEVARRFLREAALLRELASPGIVRYVDHGSTSEGDLYMAMEWLEGESLRERLRRDTRSVRDALALARGVARALSSAHGRGVVHRDVKPANLFLVSGSPELVKVLDFGIACLGSTASRQTKTGVIVGTPGYMAPEQAMADRELDARVDVFSLGAVLYECLTGRAPFVAEHPVALFAKIIFEDPPRAAALRSGVPHALDDLLRRMLAKDREHRPADAGAVERELAAIDSTPLSPTLSTRAVASTAEKHLVSITLTSPPDGSEPTENSPTLALRFDLAPLEASVEQLADGAVVAIVKGRGAATDRAAAAARCALAIRERLPTRVVALTTGLALVDGPFPTGEVIDRAVSLVRAHAGARTDGVWLDDVSAGLVDARFEVTRVDGAPLLAGAREQVDDTRPLLGKPTPFVGRERDLAFVLGLFDEAKEESVARAVLVTAPAGTGKSRLRHEVLRRLADRPDPIEVWFGRGDPVAAGAPFALIGPAIRRAAGILDGEPAHARRQKLAARVAKHVPEDRRARVAEFLGELLGAPAPDEEASVQLRSARQSPLQMAGQMRSAWIDLVAAECAAHPLVLVLEDLHWGDVPSVNCVDAILRSEHDKPLFVLALARPEVHEIFPRLWSERRVQELALSELTSRAATKLARHALGPSVPDEVVTKIVERAAGNAFFLEELARAVAEGKGPTAGTLLAVVQARTEALPSEHRRILRGASVFGEVSWRGGIAELCGETPKVVERILDELVARELLVHRRTARFPSEMELAFRHGLVREGVYAMLTDEDRRNAHFAAGEWLERAGEASALVLADHFERGGANARAAEYYARAAHQAFDAGDLALSVECASRGIRAGATGELLGDLASIGSYAQAWRAEWPEALRLGEQAMPLCRPGSRAWLFAAPAVAFAGLTLKGPSLVERGLDALEALATVAPIDETRSAHAWALTMAIHFVYLGGGPRAIAERLREQLEQVAGPVVDTEPSARGNLECGRAFAAACFDRDLAKAIEWTRRSLASLDEAGDRPMRSLVAVQHALFLVQLGEHDEAAAMTTALIRDADALGLAAPASQARVILARIACERGDLATIRACATWMLEHQQRGPYQGALVAQVLAEALRRTGDLAAAEAEIRWALGDMPPTSSDSLTARATLARVLLARGQLAEGVRVAEEAAAILADPAFVKIDECRVWTVVAEARLAAFDVEGANVALARSRDELAAWAGKIGDATLRRKFLDTSEANRRTVALVREHLGEAIK